MSGISSEAEGSGCGPLSASWTCEILGGDADEVRPFALATEILHNFLLIHDDIEDGDTMRRDQPTLWAKFGVPDALNVADYLIAKAYSLILDGPTEDAVSLRLARAFSFAFEKTVEGQALDLNLRQHVGESDRERFDLATYFRIVTHKTAYYLALTWVGAAIVAGRSDDDLELFWKLGECMGPAFQIRDDVIDLTEGKGRGGEIGCDIREGKPSILVAFVDQHQPGSEADRARLTGILRAPREETSDADIRWAIDFFQEFGAIEFADREAKRLVGECERVIDALPLGDDGRETFRAVARFVIDRKM